MVEGGVPLDEVIAKAKEGFAGASAALGQIRVLDQRGEGERVDAGLEGTGELEEFGATLLIRGGALDEAEVMSNAAVEVAERSGGPAITSAAKGAVESGELRGIIRVGGGEVVVPAHLGAEHGEALSEGIPGTEANTGINVARQATPASFSLGEEGGEGLGRGGEASIIGAELVGRGKSEGRYDVVAGAALCEVEWRFTEDGAAGTGRGVERDKRVQGPRGDPRNTLS